MIYIGKKKNVSLKFIYIFYLYFIFIFFIIIVVKFIITLSATRLVLLCFAVLQQHTLYFIFLKDYNKKVLK